MSMANARKAARDAGGSVETFVQTEGQCLGYVATWIRKRAQGKQLFSQKYLHRFEPTQRWIEEDAQGVAARAKQKAGQIMAVGPADKDLDAMDNEQRRLALQAYAAQVNDYICRRRLPGTQKADKRILAMHGPATSAPLAKLRDELTFMTLQPCYAVLSPAGGGAHAIGLDFSRQQAYAWFDPNLGEVSFAGAGDLIDWATSNWAEFAYTYTAFSLQIFVPDQGN